MCETDRQTERERDRGQTETEMEIEMEMEMEMESEMRDWIWCFEKANGKQFLLPINTMYKATEAG